MYILYYV